MTNHRCETCGRVYAWLCAPCAEAAHTRFRAASNPEMLRLFESAPKEDSQ